MRVASVTANGIQIIVYKNGDYFYEDNKTGKLTRVPDEKRKGFRTTIFRDPSKPRRPIVQEELDALTIKIRTQLKKEAEEQKGNKE